MTNQGKGAIDVVLAESLKELAITRPIERITIKEITDKAGVIRPTFYNHFQDKYELLEWIVQNELIAPARPLLDNGMLMEAITFLLTSIEKNKDFYINAARMEGQNSFEQTLQACLREEMRQRIDFDRLHTSVDFTWASSELFVGFYANCLCFPILQWIKSEMAIPIADMTEICAKILETSLLEAIRETHAEPPQ